MKDDTTKSKTESSTKTSELKTPNEWGKILKTKSHYLSGAMAHAKWGEEQKITQSEYERKLREWLNKPIGGRK